MIELRTEFTLLALALGMVAAQTAAYLPQRWQSGAVLIIAAVALMFCVVRRKSSPYWLLGVIACALGASYALVRADLRMSDALPREWEGRDIEIVGVIDELPQRDERSVRFAFRVEQTLTPGASVPSRIALGWYLPASSAFGSASVPELHAGERWRWTVRLKRPHGYVNPAGHDLEAWMLERNVRANGTIQIDELSKRLTANAGQLSDYLEQARERIRTRMQRALEDKPYAGVLIALAIGDQQAIRDRDWALFNATGVSHLLSISGAHVTLFAAWVAWLVLNVWRRAPTLNARCPAPKAAAIAAALIAVGYAALTGFAVPAQRTCYMLLTLAASQWLSRNVWHGLILLWALVIVLLIDPWAALSVGFWFSFVAVALLIYVTHGRISPESKVVTTIKAQLAITMGLAPIALAFFQQVSIVGPLTNAVAIPLVTLVMVPLTLLWMVLPIDGFLRIAHAVVDTLVRCLQWITQLATPWWSQSAPPSWTVALAMFGVLWLLAPRLVPYRWVGALWCLPMFTITPAVPEPGEFSATILDVGQGTAVVIRTHRYTLVYDTGPRWTDSSDAGERLIAPFLRASGSSAIDGLVVSHLDLDHSGGAQSLLRSTPVNWMLTSVFLDTPLMTTARERGVATQACVAGQSWVWDEVRFDVLHPSAQSYTDATVKTNDRSCVIKVSAKHVSFLLTGDIETQSEAKLVETMGGALPADAMLIPHHGSLTSSTRTFLNAVAPKQAFINAGYRNRFGHPRDAVLARYADSQIVVHRTDWHGAITIESRDRFKRIRHERDERQRYWIDRVDQSDQRAIE